MMPLAPGVTHHVPRPPSTNSAAANERPRALINAALGILTAHGVNRRRREADFAHPCQQRQRLSVRPTARLSGIVALVPRPLPAPLAPLAEIARLDLLACPQLVMASPTARQECFEPVLRQFASVSFKAVFQIQARQHHCGHVHWAPAHNAKAHQCLPGEQERRQRESMTFAGDVLFLAPFLLHPPLAARAQ